jgi:hypothetical protein
VLEKRHFATYIKPEKALRRHQAFDGYDHRKSLDLAGDDASDACCSP